MSTRDVIGIVGAGVGFLIGGPAGAAIGYTAGAAVGSYIDPVTIKAPGLSEAPAQTSNDGVPRPMVWGLHGGIHGNIIQKNPETQVTTTESQGKGGGPEVEETRRYRTFAIRVCEGPISEITRIWRNGTLVYDIRETPAIEEAETTKFAEGINIYLGTEDQLPDSELEAHWGDDTPAYRGTCYVVFVNHDLTEVGGAIPQFAFEVQASGEFSGVSKPYPLEFTDAIESPVLPNDASSVRQPVDAVEQTVTPQNGLLGGGLLDYDWTEAVEQTVTPQDGELDEVLVEYEIPDEAIETEVTPQNGLFGSGLIVYDIPDEAIEQTVTPQDGTLT
jgi:hypothetical protein